MIDETVDLFSPDILAVSFLNSYFENSISTVWSFCIICATILQGFFINFGRNVSVEVDILTRSQLFHPQHTTNYYHQQLTVQQISI